MNKNKQQCTDAHLILLHHSVYHAFGGLSVVCSSVAWSLKLLSRIIIYIFILQMNV